MIFSYVFLPILHNIGLYIYIVRYEFNIKILGFLQTISNFFLKIQKNLKTCKLISHFKKQKQKAKMFSFHPYGQILKVFQENFYIKNKKLHLFHVLKMQNKNKNYIVTSLLLSIMI